MTNNVALAGELRVTEKVRLVFEGQSLGGRVFVGDVDISNDVVSAHLHVGGGHPTELLLRIVSCKPMGELTARPVED